MICAISGVTPEDPVVSKRSGYVFEKRLIEKHLAETGTCPVTLESLTNEDLLPLKNNKSIKPRPLQATSIPGMLSLFQTEWDAVVLSNYQLEQQLHNARQELSHALYQHDAACRVIARLKKERDEALALLADADRKPDALAALEPAPSQPMSNGKRGPEEELVPAVPAKMHRPGVTPQMVQEFMECNERLSTQRKKRQASPALAEVDALKQYTQLSSHPLHKTSKPGILSIDIHQEKDLILTGGNDGNAVVFNRASEEIMGTLEHGKRVTCVKFVPRDDFVLTGSADKAVRIWQGQENGSYECKHILRDHSAEVRAVTVHPTNNYFATASSDKTWALFDLNAAICLTQVSDPAVDQGFTAAQFHPDGLIMGIGTSESLVRIWDLKQQTNVAKFEGHTGPVTDLSFSENGYYLATAATDGVKIWDLRKLKNFRTFAFYDSVTPTNSVQFDHSGSYLALAGSDTRLIQTGSVKAEWNVIKTFPDLSGTGKVTAVRFGRDAAYLAIGSSDRSLRIFGPPAMTDGSAGA